MSKDTKDTGIGEVPLSSQQLKEELEAAHTQVQQYRTQADHYKKELEELQTARRELQEADARKEGDIEALEQSWKERLTQQEHRSQDKIHQLNNTLKDWLIDKEAQGLASQITLPDSISVLIPHLKQRLQAKQNDHGDWTTAVIDSKGKPSALTLDELKKEFLNNPAFAPILRGSSASGGSASHLGDAGTVASKKHLQDMTLEEKVLFFRNHR